MKLPFYRVLIFIILVVESVYATPWIISHRGGGENFPENTLLAFSKSLEIGCDAIEIDVQVTKDGVVAVYHPEDLKKWTNGYGAISSHTWEEISTLNAGYNYKPECGYPFRDKNLHIPRIEEVLHHFPKTLIIVDIKSLPAETLIKALIRAISDEESIRLIFYSTHAEHIDLLNSYKPHWITFEKRDLTRQRFLEFSQTAQSALPINSVWMGFELKRKMMVTETFTLGNGNSTIEFHLWTPQLVSYLRNSTTKLFLVLFGINKKDEWEEALTLNVDAVYTDNPCRIVDMKKKIEKVN
ncbi:Uncharacterized protein PRO82_000555 [Candidatus Protochlamydia amoebophila]|uniref:glycerophosphodiester phosphodiesterase family protein n=1 Tax=Candidatus Protochlamydia amoebophila TaxID=362787 RepID=UPI001BC93F93|nr:glycerophosphodiester phosphodiesterase family protein [Candidatus Protochlamydia amoebophila]MBS4163255.1 Uncharacterized protein [Candidatus Protochlamydia amoebophila]